MSFNALLIFLLALHSVGEPEYRLREARGYDRGQPQTVLLQRLPGKSLDGKDIWLDHDAADRWVDLVEYAARNGYYLQPTYGFRTDAQQRRLYRQNPRLAAKPGHSNHQLGISLDLNGMSRRGKRTSLFYWMRQEAGRFGFVNDIGYEPWHWTWNRDNDVEKRSVLPLSDPTWGLWAYLSAPPRSGSLPLLNGVDQQRGFEQSQSPTSWPLSPRSVSDPSLLDLHRRPEWSLLEGSLVALAP